jgi:hypothetical protein
MFNLKLEKCYKQFKLYSIYFRLRNNIISSLIYFLFIISLFCERLIFHSYRHFDKDKSGKLDHQEFKSCLRALGYDLPVVDEGQVDPEFQAILDMVDPNRLVDIC